MANRRLRAVPGGRRARSTGVAAAMTPGTAAEGGRVDEHPDRGREDLRACPECGRERRITAEDVGGTWPVLCRACGHDFHPAPPAQEVEVAGDLRRAADPRRRYLTRWREEAATFVLRYRGDADARLVHGTRGPDGRDHAWVEVGDRVVFEAAYQRFYDRASYYAAFGAAKEVEYDRRAVAERVRATGHYGPGHKSPPDR